MTEKFEIGYEIFYEIEQIPKYIENEEIFEYLDISEEEYDEITYNLSTMAKCYDHNDYLYKDGYIIEEKYNKTVKDDQSNINDLRRFYRWSILGKALSKYFGSYQQMINKLDIYEMNGYLYFQVDNKYNTKKKNLLNEDEKEDFLKFINE